MNISEFNCKDDIQNVIIKNLRHFGIKYRQKKITYKQDKQILKRIFKVPLYLLPYENVILSNGCSVKIPRFVHEACSLITLNIETEGIFRKAGSNVRQKEIKILLDKKGKFTKEHNVIDVANVLKLFLRELPEPLIPYAYHETFLHCLRLDKNTVDAILMTCLLLPSENLATLTYIMDFLRTVATYSDHNKMDINNLAIILTPNIMPLETRIKMVNNQSNQRLTYHVRVVEILIENAQYIGIVPVNIVEQLPTAQVQDPVDAENNEKKVKKKRRSGSLTRMFNGLKKIVSGKTGGDDEMNSLPSPDLLTTTPHLLKSNKRKANDMTGLSNKKKQEVLNLLPQNTILSSTPYTPKLELNGYNCVTPERRTTIGKWFTSTPISKVQLLNQEPVKRSYLTLSGRRNKSKRCSLSEVEVSNSALKKLERRWSVVSSAASWGKKKKQVSPNLEDIPLSSDLNDVFSQTDNTSPMKSESYINKNLEPVTNNNDEIEFVRIPKDEYEEIKNRVSAIENKILEEFNNIAPPMDDGDELNSTISDVQTKYEKTLEEAGVLQNTSTDQLAKRLSRELKIRRSDRQKVIRSPSARKIGTIRRRSKEFDKKHARVERNQSWHVSNTKEISSLYSRTTLKRGRPNTVLTGLRHPSPSKLVPDIIPLVSRLGTPETKRMSLNYSPATGINRSKSFYGENRENLSEQNIEVQSTNLSRANSLTNETWQSAEGFFATKIPTPVSHETSHGSRASLAKIRTQNAGMVLAKAKLFDGLILDHSVPQKNLQTNISNRSRRQSTRLNQIKQKSTNLSSPSKRNQKSPNNLSKKYKTDENLNKENSLKNLEYGNSVLRKSVSPLKDSNKINKILKKPSDPQILLSVTGTPKNTPQIKKPLMIKSPKYLKQSTLVNSSDRYLRTPIKAVHSLQNTCDNTPKRCSPRLLLRSQNLSTVY